MITLKHIDPSPKGAGIITELLLPCYGWAHKQANKKYPSTEMSFRSTTNAVSFTKRGFKIVVDKKEEKIRFIFDSTKVDCADPLIQSWLDSIKKKVGLGPLVPDPYWGFEDLIYAIGSKIKNCFYVIADAKILDSHEYFHYRELYILTGFSRDRLIDCIENAIIYVDFDARTGHNHGTKFRIRQNNWSHLYSSVEHVF